MCCGCNCGARVQKMTTKGIQDIKRKALKSPLLGRSSMIGRAKTETAEFRLLPGMVGLIEKAGWQFPESLKSFKSFRVG